MPMPSTTTAIAADGQWVCAVQRQAIHEPIRTIPVHTAGATTTGMAVAAVITTVDAAIHTAVVQAAVQAATTVHGEVPVHHPAVLHTAMAARPAVTAQVAEDSVHQVVEDSTHQVVVSEVAAASVAAVAVKYVSLCQVIKFNITLR